MKIFIGGAWLYGNSSAHVGHLAALLPGDVIARYYRMNGDEVIFDSGTDCHGTPITLRARKEHVTAESIASKYHEEFKKCWVLDNLRPLDSYINNRRPKDGSDIKGIE